MANPLIDLLSLINRDMGREVQARRNSHTAFGTDAANWASTKGIDVIDLLEQFERDPKSVWRDVMYHPQGNPDRAERIMSQLSGFAASRQGQGTPPPRGFHHSDFR